MQRFPGFLGASHDLSLAEMEERKNKLNPCGGALKPYEKP